MKTVCIYHSIDLDGWMSAAIVKLWHNEEHKEDDDNLIYFEGYNYTDPLPELKDYDKIILVDISFPAKIMYEISHDKKVIWIDHHISAINDMNEVCTEHNLNPLKGLRDIKFAACELTWQYFFPNIELPEIVRLLGRYDCFGHKGTKEERKVLEFQYGARQSISNYLEAYEQLIQCTRVKESEYWFLQSQVVMGIIHEEGKSIYKYLCSDAKQSYKNGFEIYFRLESDKLYRFICINKERFNPINFGIDYHKDGYDGCACFHYANGKWNFSLYNDNELIDCSIIAKQFGGGGHKGASGFTTIDINSILKNKI